MQNVKYIFEMVITEIKYIIEKIKFELKDYLTKKIKAKFIKLIVKYMR